MRFFAVLFEVLVTLCAFSQAAPIVGTEDLHAAAAAAHGAVNNYIVVFQSGVDTPDSVFNRVLADLKSLGAKVNYKYETIMKGFSITIDSDLLPKLLDINDSKYPFIVEADKTVHIE